MCLAIINIAMLFWLLYIICEGRQWCQPKKKGNLK